MNATSIRVLLVEDNPPDARLIRELLRGDPTVSFTVEHVERLDAGLERLASNAFDIVLLDLTLPDSRGVSTFSRIHEGASQMPTIIMTHLDDQDVAVSIVQRGAQDYLVKGDVDSRLLVRSIRYAIERKRAEEQLEQYAAQLRQRNAEMEEDLRMAREVQDAFLLREYPRFPSDCASGQSALRFCHLYQPCGAMGGDFFDIRAVSATAAGVTICDVMGQGLRASLVAAILRGLMHEGARACEDPVVFMREVNTGIGDVFRQADQVVFATACYLVADAATGRLAYASAGHPSPLLVQRRTGTVEWLAGESGRRGPALGLVPVAQYPLIEGQIEPGDLVVLFTDGVLKAEDANREEFGLRRLERVVQTHIREPGERILHEVKRAVEIHTGGRLGDDLCMVGVELRQLA